MIEDQQQQEHTEEVKEIFRRLGKEEMQQIVMVAAERAMTNWLNEKFSTFGKWTLRTIGAGLFILALKILLAAHLLNPGWLPPAPPVK